MRKNSLLIGPHRDSAPLTPHTRQDVGGGAGAAADLAAGSRREVPLSPVVLERILERQEVDPSTDDENASGHDTDGILSSTAAYPPGVLFPL